ncbi:hypothetical protein PEL8287_00810 [Roseovarius litorisediminis]|uniref:Coiled coil domain-containing protein n=1 Tax=Roseovarius litorisediminis TaxID=1312363 RepID=A0A1Y5RKM8_9RHOB|nr:conserved coiled coil protein [Roseovarius litorisediminis]SLN19745.1 hypothetical protein PEL8287_00810 [Roseovarius litorisediminis]
MDNKQAYQEKLEAKLDEWHADIDKLRAKAEGAQADAKLTYEKNLKDLKEHRDKLEKELEKLRDTQTAAWHDIKRGADEAWDSMSKAMKDAYKRFT